jgi:hypothetical protein
MKYGISVSTEPVYASIFIFALVISSSRFWNYVKYSSESRSIEYGMHCHLYLAHFSLLDGGGRTDEPVASKSDGSPQSKFSTIRKPQNLQVSRIALQGESAMAKQAHAVQLDALPLPALQVEVPLQLTVFLGVGLRWDSQPDLFSQTTANIVASGRPL